MQTVLLGEIALSTFLIIGFTLHNTTEGLAIVAPLAKSRKLMLRRLVLMGMIAGAPTIAGAWIGGFLLLSYRNHNIFVNRSRSNIPSSIFYWFMGVTPS